MVVDNSGLLPEIVQSTGTIDNMCYSNSIAPLTLKKRAGLKTTESGLDSGIRVSPQSTVNAEFSQRVRLSRVRVPTRRTCPALSSAPVRWGHKGDPELPSKAPVPDLCESEDRAGRGTATYKNVAKVPEGVGVVVGGGVRRWPPTTCRISEPLTGKLSYWLSIPTTEHGQIAQKKSDTTGKRAGLWRSS